jgi:hypothetical protein
MKSEKDGNGNVAQASGLLAGPCSEIVHGSDPDFAPGWVVRSPAFRRKVMGDGCREGEEALSRETSISSSSDLPKPPEGGR